MNRLAYDDAKNRAFARNAVVVDASLRSLAVSAPTMAVLSAVLYRHKS